MKFIQRTMQLTLVAGLVAASPSAWADVHVVKPGDDAQEKIQEALILAEPGDVIELEAGNYDLTDGLSLDIDQVTLQGAGPEKTVLSFAGQKGSGEGLLVTSDNVVLRDFAIEDTRGDGIKSKDANNIVYHNLRVEWTGGPKETNGSYGIYPVESENVLVDGVEVIGASDAGIYVGQSRNIIVRHSLARYNVAGIEIENCYNADVYGNYAAHNTGGILVFDLPDLPQQGGHNVRIFSNVVSDNDTANFAPKGNIVANVPMGTGVMIMANHDVEIFDNVLAENATSNILVVGYPFAFKDKNYNPLPRDIRIGKNRHGPAGYAPGLEGGQMLASALGGSLPPVLWDGLNGAAALKSSDSSPVLTLNLKKQGEAFNKGIPSLAQDLAEAKMTLPAITMPQSMEDALRR